MGKKKAVIDTNTLISAFGWEGKEKEVLRKFLSEEFQLVICEKQVEELRRVLDYPKLGFTKEEKTKLLSIIYSVCDIADISGDLAVIKEDVDDNMILESAIEGKADFIISGDKHLLKLKEYEGIKIMTASEFIDMIK